jgi:hypothetical protein
MRCAGPAPNRNVTVTPIARHRFRVATLAVALLLSAPARAHDPRLELPDPLTVQEAWDVIRQCTDNLGKLLETNQLKDVPFQVAVCSPQFRLLEAQAATTDARPDELKALLAELFDTGTAIILASREKTEPRQKAEAEYRTWRTRLDAIAARYKPDVVAAPVYVCPMHPADRHLKVDARCTVCEMKLVRRRIPSGGAYEMPGQPTMTMALSPDVPLEVGRKVNVRVALARKGGQPVAPGDLLVMHTERVHLLIVDRSLGDYHHEHPVASTEHPGDYTFAFTPRKPGPYRVFADVVPGATGVQEYVIADLPAGAEGEPIAKSVSGSVVVDGLKYDLTFDVPGGGPLRAGQLVAGRVQVSDPADGEPFAKLEPLMGAFAHLVGFAEDHKTVVHIHPSGAEPTDDAARGGPALPFKFYAPVGGYMRLYVQVCVDGKWRFAPFGIDVQPALPAAAPKP